MCGRQNIPLHGHHDSDLERDNTENHGKIRALLQFRVEAGDKLSSRISLLTSLQTKLGTRFLTK